MNNLYVLTNKFVELMNNEELTEEQYEELGVELAKELQIQSSDVIAYVVDSESLFERIKAEEERLATIRKRGEEKLKKFKQCVLENMLKLDIKKIQTELGTMSVAKNPISVEIIEEKDIPEEFIKVKVEKSVDKMAIKKHFQETGEVIEGTRIIDNKKTLRIN